MKKVNFIGNVIVALGVLNLFRKAEGLQGFGGYVDNIWEILLTSLILIVTGLLMIFISRRMVKNE
jgi:hypothetical protein